MAVVGTNVANQVDTAQLERKLAELTVSTSSLRVPFFGNHQKSAAKGSVSNPHDYAHRAVPKQKVVLTAAFAPGDTTMTIAAGTTKAPIQINLGLTEVAVSDTSGLLFKVTGRSSTGTVLTVQRTNGSHTTTYPIGTEFPLTSNVPDGQDMQDTNEGLVYSYGLNYISNKTLTYQVSKLLEEGYLASYKSKDYTIEDRQKIAALKQLLELEHDCLYSPKIAGADSSSRNGNVISTAGSRMGGFIPEIVAGDCRSVDQTGKPISMAMLLRDVRYLDAEGAFDTFASVSPRDSSVPLIYMYCDRNLKFDLYRLMLMTATGDVLAGDKKFGYSADMIHLGGVDIKPVISDKIGTGRYVLEGKPENNEILVLRDRVETANTNGVSGDNIKKEEATTLTGRFYAPWQNAYNYNLGPLLD